MFHTIKIQSLICYRRTSFSLGILLILYIINVLHPLNISFSCRPNKNHIPSKYFVSENYTSEISKETDDQDQDITVAKRPIKVCLGTVVCRGQDDLGPLEEALVLLKSTIISAILYKTLPLNIEFHLCLEHEKDIKYFLTNIQPFANSQHKIQVDIRFHSVFDVVPKQYKDLLFGSDLRCEYVRIFFPSGLPKLDSILYLDTDAIITGNVVEIWNNFYKMADSQLVGAVMDIEPDNQPWFNVYKSFFQNTPVPTPRGLNSGVLLMNLTKMRKYEFSDKIIRLFNDYTIYKRDQTLLNTLLFYNPSLLYLLPCQYNFRPTACSLGFYCRGVIMDPTGLQIIHQYQKSMDNVGKGNAFRDIVEAYQNITHPGMDLRINLLIKVRNMYKEGFKSAYDHGKCNGILSNLLFRKFFL